jgi:hypothetical protein
VNNRRVDDSELESIEWQLSQLPLASAPHQLRTAVLSDMRRQVKAQRWERRMAQAAVALLLAGIGMNAAVGWQSRQSGANPAIADSRPEAIARAAAFMAEATDAETGREFARHLAALSGTTLDRQQEAAIERQIESHSKTTAAHRKDG